MSDTKHDSRTAFGDASARKRDKLVIGVGDRVDLTGLEVQS